MNEIGEFITKLLAQFGGGPGPPENNLVRFGLAAAFWGVLLLFAWSRQHQAPRPRERWLIIGFGLAFFRDFFMFSHLSHRLITGAEHDALCSVMVPIEHALTLLAIVLISGAFLRYILDNAWLARRYLILGFGLSLVATLAIFGWWPRQLAVDPTVRFHTTWMAWFLHLLAAGLIVVAIVLLVRERGWLSNVVVLALTMILLSECLVLVNLITARSYSSLLCPLGNSLYIWAIPVFGFVYFREQAHEKQAAEATLHVYRNHLEELVDDRTTALTTINARLQTEIIERKQIERENTRLYDKTERWAQGMAALHAMSIELTSTLDGATLGELIVGQSAQLIGCPISLLYRWDEPTGTAQLFAAYNEDVNDGPTMPNAPPQLKHLPRAIHRELQTRRPFIINMAEQCSCIVAEWKILSKDHSIIGVPLHGTQMPLNFLLLIDNNNDDQCLDHDVNLLENYAGQAAAALENAYLHQQLEMAATLEERQRIAAEMHDGLAQTLSYLGLKTDRAAEKLEDGNVEDVLGEFGEIQTIIGRATQDVRRSIASLQAAPEPRQSLAAALRRVLSEVKRAGPPEVELTDAAAASTVYPPAEELEQVTRVVAEALTNARRHAAAQHIVVHAAVQGDALSVAIIDDGKGFRVAAPSTSNAGHFGLSIMRARAARIDGKLTIDSSPTQGTRVTLTWQARPEFSASSVASDAPAPISALAPELVDPQNGVMA